ncbi:hypothetical protein EYF80_026915 [Liparis tanakae]|uniref:Uncharacterized protein n=1 Tax=Liparis tanakae TaxID=230148 RepID=A0A4Z2HBD9_9TELE|nr:hypothetical protein EYF80_026915 [Liparis tanakae]
MVDSSGHQQQRCGPLVGRDSESICPAIGQMDLVDRRGSRRRFHFRMKESDHRITGRPMLRSLA